MGGRNEAKSFLSRVYPLARVSVKRMFHEKTDKNFLSAGTPVNGSTA